MFEAPILTIPAVILIANPNIHRLKNLIDVSKKLLKKHNRCDKRIS